MRKETLKRLKEHPNLRKYALHFKRTEGDSEEAGFLPFVVIWFRQLFDKAGIDDGEVPILFEMDDETAEDFWSWGHNSRYNHTFSEWLLGDLDFCLDIAFQIIDNNEKLKGFDIDVKKIVEQDKKELLERMKGQTK